MYVIYLRKSRKDSDLEALGIDVLKRHEETLLELARARSLPIGAIYREVVSGDSIDARPEMVRLLSEVESGIWEGVLVMEVERLARGDTIDQGRVQRAFFYSNTLIVTPGKTYNPAIENDNEYFEFSLFMSRREYATIKRRMQAGRIRSVKDGYYVGNIAPYGWRRVKADDCKHFTLVPDEKENPVLKLMYDFMGNKKYGFQKTCSALTGMGIVSRSGKPFNPATVKTIISNPVNIGMLRWNYRKSQKAIVNGKIATSRPKADDYILVKGKHPGCISEDLYYRANSVNSSMTAPVKRSCRIQNPFAGIVRCSCCGRVMVRKKMSAKQPRDYLICQYAGCTTVAIELEELENAVLEWIRNYIADYKVNIFESTDDSEQESLRSILVNLEKEKETTLKQRGSLFDLLEQGIYTKEIFFERSTALEDKIKDFDKKIESVNADIVRLDLSKKNRSTFVPKCQELLNAWDTFDAADKNTALKNVIERIDFTKTEKNARGQRHSSFSIDVFPRISR